MRGSGGFLRIRTMSPHLPFAKVRSTFLLFAIAAISPMAFAQNQTEPAKKDTAQDKSKPTWNTDTVHGPKKDIELTLEEGTWMNLDVSDRQTDPAKIAGQQDDAEREKREQRHRVRQEIAQPFDAIEEARERVATLCRGLRLAVSHRKLQSSVYATPPRLERSAKTQAMVVHKSRVQSELNAHAPSLAAAGDEQALSRDPTRRRRGHVHRRGGDILFAAIALERDAHLAQQLPPLVVGIGAIHSSKFSVGIGPGAIALTRMFGASSTESVLVRLFTAALAAP